MIKNDKKWSPRINLEKYKEAVCILFKLHKRSRLSPQSAAHLFVVHVVLILSLAPQFGHTLRLHQHKLSRLSRPPNRGRFPSRRESFQQKLPQLNGARIFRRKQIFTAIFPPLTHGEGTFRARGPTCSLGWKRRRKQPNVFLLLVK